MARDARDPRRTAAGARPPATAAGVAVRRELVTLVCGLGAGLVAVLAAVAATRGTPTGTAVPTLVFAAVVVAVTAVVAAVGGRERFEARRSGRG